MRAVVGDRVLAERIAHALHAGRVLGGSELLRRDARHRLLDRRLSLGRVEPLALGRREHDVQHAPLLGGELRLDQVGRPLRIRPRDLELVPKRAPDRHHQEDEHDDDSDPAEDNAPRMRRTHPRPARERPRSEPFVGSEPFAGRRLSVRAGLLVLVLFHPVLGHERSPLRRVEFPLETC